MIPIHLKSRSRTLVATLLAAATLTPVFASPRDTALQDGPLGYYELGTPNLPGTIYNSVNVGNATNLAAAGTSIGVLPIPGALSGRPNTGAHFNGVKSLATVPFSTTLNPAATASFSIEAWVAPGADGAATPQVILSNGTTQGWKLTQGASGYNFSFYNGTATPAFTLSGGTYVPNLWSHVVVTYNGSTKTAVLYVDGGQVQTKTAVSYTANTTQPFTLGGDSAGARLFTGGIDEVAFYGTALTSDQVGNHANNGFNTFPDVAYETLITGTGSANATVYLRLDEKDSNRVVAVNEGSLGTKANGYQFPGAVMQVPGAIASSTNNFAVNYRAIDASMDGNNATILPYQPEMNTQSFSAEAWIRPTSSSGSNACVVFRNHDDVDPGNRSGWVVWQRDPSVGFNLRLYNHVGTTRTVDINSGPYTVGAWLHMAVTYDDSSKTAKIYINGLEKATATVASGVAFYPMVSTVIPSFGGFANGQENPFIGDIDEVAYYSKVLTPAQIAAHNTNGKDANRTSAYDTLVKSDAPVAYYRQNEAAQAQVPNLGSLGPLAVGTTVNSPASVAGPGAPDQAGFGTDAKASVFGSNTYVELNNPAGMNIAGEITLEAWVQPKAEQPASATIIGHGGDLNFANEVFLRIESNQYQIGHGGGGSNAVAAADIPAGDLGTTGWVHLAGTWSNTTKLWTIYRNGVALATTTDNTGVNAVNNANWAIGARGRWHVKGFPVAPEGDQRVFSGAIATAGIYNKALTTEQLLAHYQSGVTLTPALSPLVIVQQGNNVTLTWQSGILAQSTDLINWADVPNATSPYQTTVAAKQFFRLHD